MPDKPATILVVEDEEHLRGLLRLTMERAAYRVIEAADGEQALALVAEQLPELVLLDIDLPGIDGFAVCQRLRASPLTQDVRVIMVTAMGEESQRARGLAVGADGYIVKPFGPFELLARIERELGSDRGRGPRSGGT